ncbi:ClC family H(+)/Cl(-) exchange transporter [Caldanaerobius polysaccharolyticus]|uniref:ClC family H(+)/Cl(-) exchange transporter n=1 Tax=Caldanaerobius polysaccharolyticus TaxID=44256 RepID=UPI00047D11B6|nr:ClC family H(+)/Cl(-) exchange transporter [Caldanaerobius polysaccharolyticus]
MKEGKSSTYRAIKNWEEFRKRIIVEGIFTGALVGLIVSLFRFLIGKLNILLINTYAMLHVHTYLIFMWVVILLVIGFIIGFILKKEPMIGGSGIPQVKGMIIGHLKANWMSVIVSKFIGTILAIGAGLSLGREGPCVQLGASVGQGISRLLGRLRVEEKYLLTSGASAGLAAAFNAPLAGTIFALEELHKNFSPLVLVSAMVASLTSTFVADSFLGLKTVFNLKNLYVVPLKNYLYLIILGVIVGLCGILFNKTLLKTQDLYRRINIKDHLKPIIPLLMSIPIGLYIPHALGGGEEIVDKLTSSNWGFKFVLLLLIVKFLFTMASYGSGAPGGIFMPLLIIGALIGDIYGSVIIRITHMNPVYLNNFVILAMSGYFAAIVRAPITGSLLVTEMTGSFSHLLSLSTVSITAYLSSSLFGNAPIYESLLDRILRKNAKESCNDKFDKESKTIFEVPVCVGSILDGKKIKDLELPDNFLIVGIKRGTTEVIPKGDTKILPGDYIVVLADKSDALKIKEKLSIPWKKDIY